MTACPLRTTVMTAQNRLFVQVAICVAVLVTIHWLPKQVPDAVRLVYTVAYFAALLALLYQSLNPLTRYLQLLFAWRYEGAPDPITRATKSFLFSLQQLIAAPACLLLAFFGSVALLTLAMWFPDLTVLAFLYNLVWWTSLIGFLLFPFAGGFLFQEAAQKYRALDHETQLSSFTPRNLSELAARDQDDRPQPLEVLDGLQFRGGGFTWQWRDFVENCVVFGQIGSGKTSCVLNSLIDGLLSSAARTGEPASGLILDPKGGFFRDIQHLCLRLKRGADLLVIDPEKADSLHWNPLDSDDDAYELATRFAAVSRSLGGQNQGEAFWLIKSTMFIQYALELIRLSNPPDEPPSFSDINSLVNSFAAIADRTDRLDVEDPRCHRCLDYFAGEWAGMAAETRCGIQAHLTGMLFPFLSEPYATVFAGKSTIRVAEMIDTGKIVYLHMPTADRERMARTVGIFLKLEYYREILKRPRKTRPSFFFCDEFQKFFTAGSKQDKEQEKSDADTFRLSRESFHANIVATQNVGALGELEVAQTFLGNCLTSIFLRNSDEPTNQYAAQLFSQELMGMGGISQGSPGGRLKPMAGNQVNMQDGLQQRCPPHKFRELAVCSPQQEHPHTESLVFIGGRGESPIPVRKLKWKRHPLSV